MPVYYKAVQTNSPEAGAAVRAVGIRSRKRRAVHLLIFQEYQADEVFFFQVAKIMLYIHVL